MTLTPSQAKRKIQRSGFFPGKCFSLTAEYTYRLATIQSCKNCIEKRHTQFIFYVRPYINYNFRKCKKNNSCAQSLKCLGSFSEGINRPTYCLTTAVCSSCGRISIVE